MCGIAGKLLFDRERTVDAAMIRRMTDALVHRGPDDEGIWNHGSIALAHRRLAVIDTSTAGRQPMSNEDGKIWISYNGEIYNHVELRHDLEERGHRYRSRSDTETILHLYEEHGRDCVKYLRGMFAFAIWDDRRRLLLLARDRLGKKPLLYYESQEGITFASELKAILQDETVSAQLDEISLHHYLTYGYVPGPRTIFRGVRKLSPASTLCWQDGKLAIERYWTLAYTPKLEIDEDQAAAQVLELLREATRIRLMSDVPVGALLSGGIDSSAVVAFMAEEANAPVKTFSIGFEDESFDETPYARRVANLYRTEHHEFTVTPRVLTVLPELVWAYGEPFGDSSALPTYYVAKLTRGEVTVALTGDGGDEAFAGYERYVANDLSERYGRLPAWVREGVIAPIARRIHEPAKRKHPLRRFKRFVLADQSDPARRHLNWLTLMDDRTKRALYTDAFREIAAGHDSAAVFDETYRSADGDDSLDRTLYSDVHTYLPDDLLVKIDIASMVHSLEVRSPFLDQRVVEFAARLPVSFKLRGRTGKYILKRALRDRLPRSILSRGKFGFSVPVGRWFRESLRDTARLVLTDPKMFERGFFSEAGVRRLLDEHQSGRVNHGTRIWELLALELWFRTYMDRPRSQLTGPAEGIMPGSARAVV